MPTIKFYKLVTGEVVIGELVFSNSTVVVLKNVAWVSIEDSENDSDPHNILTKNMFDEIELYTNNIIYAYKVEASNILTVYNKIYNP